MILEKGSQSLTTQPKYEVQRNVFLLPLVLFGTKALARHKYVPQSIEKISLIAQTVHCNNG